MSGDQSRRGQTVVGYEFPLLLIRPPDIVVSGLIQVGPKNGLLFVSL